MEKTKKLHKKIITREKIILTSLSVFFLLAFFGFTLWVRADHLRSFDFDTTVRLQNNTPLRFDDFFSFLSVIGRFEYTFPTLLLLVLLMPKLSWKRKGVAFIAFIGVFGMAHVIELLGKNILEQPGPPRMFLRSHFSDFPGIHVFTDASYPSGHSLRVVVLAIIGGFVLFKSKIPQIIKYAFYLAIFGITIAMLYSRISLGEHWMTDVIGGALLGVSAAAMGIMFLWDSNTGRK